jgi:hypothetical protein
MVITTVDRRPGRKNWHQQHTFSRDFERVFAFGKFCLMNSKSNFASEAFNATEPSLY